MLTIFNRAELLLTRDPARFRQVQEILKNAGIDYTAKQTDPTSPHPLDRAAAGALGLRPTAEYKIYVNKKNLEKARYHLSRGID